MTVSPSIESEFAGVYVEHWEVSRLSIEVGRRLWGLLPKRERWQAHFPPDFRVPEEDKQTESLRRRRSRFFRIRFIGVPSEVGRFGHKGFCHRKVDIKRVLEMAEINNPGDTW
jgi:hypothetical protein